MSCSRTQPVDALGSNPGPLDSESDAQPNFANMILIGDLNYVCLDKT